MPALGPFDVTATQIEGLASAFTEFVNRLMRVEVSSHQIDGFRLTTNIKETTPDGGVDAALCGARRTDWLPEGDSAWQFKRSRLGPKACADELEGAEWAQEYLRSGGSYVLVLGSALTDREIQDRRKRVSDKAVELQLLPNDNPERIRVYDANQLARWVSSYPSLAVSRLTGGPGSVAVDFQSWSESRRHQTEWTGDADRDAAIQTIRDQVTSSGIVELRVQGEAGIGKTRLVMEAMRADDLQPWVAYVSEEGAVGGELLAHLIEDGRRAILVVDECAAERHVKLVEKLPADPAIKLITIGHSGAVVARTPVICVAALGGDDADKFLKANYPGLSPEARRFVSDHSQGNLQWTIVLAERVLRSHGAQAAELIRRDDIEQFIAALLPEGRAFFFCAVLALVERVGWDRDRRTQLETLALFANASLDDMEAVGCELERRGLLTRQGRYRAIGPRPLSVFLAAEAWRTEGDRITGELLPALDEEMALALFSRVADLGRFEPARAVLPQLLSEGGPFGSLSAIGVGKRGKLLTQLAIVLPDEVAWHLAELVEAAPLEDLKAQTEPRRDLVWTLEKLAWHSRTFESAANSLLRLALAENETYGNNASGVWAELFGAMLPGTAASPKQRLSYIQKTAGSDDPTIRMRAVAACHRALTVHESIGVSGELQGGVLVESRGAPKTWGELAEYRRGAIEILDGLVSDSQTDIADAAFEALLQCLHPFAGDRLFGDCLVDALAKSRGARLVRLRQQIEELLNLFRQHNPEGDRLRIEGLGHLAAALPPTTPEEQLAVWLQFRHWDLRGVELRSRVLTTLKGIPNRTGRNFIMRALGGSEVPGAWELGHSLAVLEGKNVELEKNLWSVYSANAAALVGYLRGLADEGCVTAFDDFLESKLAEGLDTLQSVSIAVRGPCTPCAKDRVLTGLRSLPVAQGTYVLFGWQDNLKQNDVKLLLDDWLARASTQEDYNAVVDWLHLWLYPREVIPRWLRGRAFKLVMLRDQYPGIGQQQWDWSRLASSFVPEKTRPIRTLVLDLISAGSLMVFGEDQDSGLLLDCAKADPTGLWGDIADRLASGDWRIMMDLRGWLLVAIPANVLVEWIGTETERARLVASVAPTGGDEPTAIARFLLDKFGDDDKVAASLSGDFISGSWAGNESDRLTSQIEQLNRWRNREEEPRGVRHWAGRMVEHLERQRREALEREAERDY